MGNQSSATTDNYQSVGKLKSPPLVYTAGFVLINLNNVAEYIAKLQDRLRDDYPSFFTFDFEITELYHKGQARNKTTKCFALSDSDLKWGVVVNENRFIFQTVDYQHFADFGLRFEHALNTFIEVTGLKHHSGLAYRQIDNFKPTEEEKLGLKECVNSQFLTIPLSEAIKVKKPVFSRQEHRFSLENDASLVLRTYCFNQDDGPSIPDDLLPLCLSLDPSIIAHNKVKSPFVLADFEVNRIPTPRGKSELLNIKKTVAELDKFHQYSSLVFREVIKADALERRRNK